MDGYPEVPPKGSGKVVGSWVGSSGLVYWVLPSKGANGFALAKLGSAPIGHFSLSLG